MRVGFLHGFTGAASSAAPLFEALGLRPTFAPALLGHADAPLEIESFDGEVERLAAALSASGGVDLLLGYSMGGRIALRLVERFPQHVGRLVVIGAHPGLLSEPARASRRADDEPWIRLLLGDGTHAFVDAWAARPIFASQLDAPDARRAAQDRVRRAHRAEGLARAMRVLGLGAMPRVDLGAVATRTPSLFVAGARDEKFRALGVAQFKPAGFALASCEGAGHNPLLETPAELAMTLRPFLDAARAA